jgi:hypothetical protein
MTRRTITLEPDRSDETARIHEVLRPSYRARGSIAVDYPVVANGAEIAVELGVGDSPRDSVLSYIPRPGRFDIPESIPANAPVWIRCYGGPRRTAVTVTVELEPQIHARPHI